MSLTIAEAMQQAQEALNGGNYRSAVTTCMRLVRHYPNYAAAHRLLGEAYLEQGQASDAERAFASALSGNPRHPWAYLGLGLIAEERGANDPALAYCQVAWELAPQLPQLREPVTRAAARRYGPEGQLQLTRAALAQLHANASRLRRAATEFRAALGELPERVDLQLGLAETLWRLGENDEAARMCAAVTAKHPDAVQALAIQADIAHRSGNARQAEELRARLRAVDPDGTVTALLLANHHYADQAFLALSDDAIPMVSDDADAVVAERPHIAPAPDFEYVPTRPEAKLPALDDLQPISVEEFGGVAEEQVEAVADVAVDELEMPQPAPPTSAATDAEVTASAMSASAAPETTGVIDEFVGLAAALQDEVASALQRAGEPETLPIDDQAFDLEANLPPSETPSGYTTMLRELNDQGLAPFDVFTEQDPFAGLELPELAPFALEEEDDSVVAEAPSASAPPTATPSTEMTAEAASTLRDEAPAIDEFADLAAQWDNVDAEIRQAVPDAGTTGYTDELRTLADIGLEPFAPDEETIQTDLVAPAPFESAELPSLAEELLLASEPATSDASATADELERTAPTMDAEVPAAVDMPDDDALLGGLEPFLFEEFEQTQPPRDGQAVPFTFGQLPWETQAGKSAVPSDEDLEALLAAEDEPFLEEFQTQPSSAPEAVAETDLPTASAAELEPRRDAYDFQDMLDSSLAVTRELATQPVESTPDVTQPLATVTGATSPAETSAGTFNTQFDDPLTAVQSDAELFERARAAKQALVDSGRIAGDKELGQPEPSAADVPVVSQPVVEDLPAEPTPVAVSQTGLLRRDVAMLRAALAADPDDAEMRWWLAEALRERGEATEAMPEYRWLIRHAPARQDAVLRALMQCIEQHHEVEMAHRLLADVYRRRGDTARASNHAARALLTRQRERAR